MVVRAALPVVRPPIGMTALLLTQVRSLALAAAASVARVRLAAAAAGAGHRRARRAWCSAGRWWPVPTSGPWRSAAIRWPTGSPASLDDGVVRHLSGGARLVPDLHAVGAAVRVSLRRRHRPLGHDARVLRRLRRCGKLRPSTSRFSRPAGCSTAASRCGSLWAPRSPRVCGPATCVAVHATGSMQESGTAILCLQLMLLACASPAPPSTRSSASSTGPDRRVVGAAVRRRRTAGGGAKALSGDA